jgi:GDPmannose 4,6-dehydratase
MRTALVTGLTGQDGTYLADSLVDAGWEVHGFLRAPVEGESAARPEVIVHPGDLGDVTSVQEVILDVQPDVIFNLGGISSVAQSWSQPVLTSRVSGTSVAAIMEASWQLQDSSGKSVRVIQASSSEIFGLSDVLPQNELTPVRPVSPYGAAKAYAHHMVSMYRARGMFASSAILYNHESPLRPPSFVTRKITHEVARIAAGLSRSLTLGNLDAARDWGWAPDYVDAMVRMAAAEEPGDYVVATGTAHTVREFVAAAFSAAGVADWEKFVSIDPAFNRPTDTPVMVGDSSKLRRELGWAPTVDFEELVATMVEHDAALL